MNREREDELLRTIYPQLRRFAAVVGPIEAAPDDLVHDALVRVLSTRNVSDLDAPVAYLCRAILNEASNHRRWLGRRRRAHARLTDSAQAAHDSYPHDLAHLQALAPRDRAVLFLRDIEGRDYGSSSPLAATLVSASPKQGKTSSCSNDRSTDTTVAACSLWLRFSSSGWWPVSAPCWPCGTTTG